jgi:hypothetical protein
VRLYFCPSIAKFNGVFFLLWSTNYTVAFILCNRWDSIYACVQQMLKFSYGSAFPCCNETNSILTVGNLWSRNIKLWNSYLEDYCHNVERRFGLPNDPESYAGGSVRFWQSYPCQTGQRVGPRRIVVPGTPCWALGMGLISTYTYSFLNGAIRCRHCGCRLSSFDGIFYDHLLWEIMLKSALTLLVDSTLQPSS